MSERQDKSIVRRWMVPIFVGLLALGLANWAVDQLGFESGVVDIILVSLVSIGLVWVAAIFLGFPRAPHRPD